GAKLPATSCLGAFWTPAARARGTLRHPASKNLHKCRQPEAKLGHVEQRMPILAQFMVGEREHVSCFAKMRCREATRSPKNGGHARFLLTDSRTARFVPQFVTGRRGIRSTL